MVNKEKFWKGNLYLAEHLLTQNVACMHAVDNHNCMCHISYEQKDF